MANNLLDDIKSADPKRPGDWPWPLKLLAMLGILILFGVVGYFAFYQGQLDAFDAEKVKENTLKDEWIKKKKLAVNLDAYKQQRAEIEQSFGALLKQLPTKAEIAALLNDVNQQGLGRGLQFDLFRPAASGEAVSEYYAELPVEIKVTGNYHDIGSFASDIAKLPRILLLNDLLLVSDAKTGLITMAGTAKTYRYLDDAEVASSKKRAAGAKAAGAKK
jgi:type IV pilus assembly protein PilO